MMSQAHAPVAQKTYATFGLKRSYHQLKHAIGNRSTAEQDMAILLEQVYVAEQRMKRHYRKPIENMRILELGPGQGMERAYYFGRKNEIVGLDLDVIPQGFEPLNYLRMWKSNGFGRFAKTIGRELAIGRANRRAWANLTHTHKVKPPTRIYGDIGQDVPEYNAFDMMMSWSVFEHVPDPEAALDNVLRSLRPGGMFYISLHLYTCNNGHHDIRSFTGDQSLPLWGHLRPQTKDSINPSSYLNEWRISQWRDLFERKSPGYTEILEQFEHPEVYGPKLNGTLREELSDYSDDELLTVNLVYMGTKPA